jgi:lupus La protein
MSVEEVVTEGLSEPLDHNAQAAEDAKRMLAELESDAAPAEKTVEETGEKKNSPTAESTTNTNKDAEKLNGGDEHENEDDQRERRQDRGRREHNGGGRGRGRGRGRNGYGGGDRDGERDSYQNRHKRENHSRFDPSTKEVTDNPVEIRKQVHSLRCKWSVTMLTRPGRSTSTLATQISPVTPTFSS